MTYPAYSEYKDSDVSWFGEVPGHWRVAGFKKYLNKIVDYRGKTPEKTDSGVFLVTARNIKNGEINYDLSQEFIAEGDYENVMSRGKPKIGEVLFTTEAPLGEVACVDREDIALAQRIIKFNGKAGLVDNAYLKYLIMSDQFQQSLMMYATGSTALGIKAERLVYLRMLMPSEEEQKQIATFLDRETKKIDRLIEKQQQLIKLLQEKRQAVISHAVTKGLNPTNSSGTNLNAKGGPKGEGMDSPSNAKMKESGVEWLGEIPEHWGVKNLRFLGLCQNGINIGAEYFGSGYSFISYGDVYNNRVLPLVGSGLVQSSDLDRERYSVKSGDVFFTRTSETIDEIGFSSACFADIENATFAGFLIRFRPTTSLISIEFSKHYFGNMLLRAFFVKEMNLVTRASLSQDLLKKLPVVIPPINEQLEIGKYLDVKLSAIDMLVKKAINAIALIKERRTALISAAVTGKIDVRNVVNG